MDSSPKYPIHVYLRVVSTGLIQGLKAKAVSWLGGVILNLISYESWHSVHLIPAHSQYCREIQEMKQFLSRASLHASLHDYHQDNKSRKPVNYWKHLHANTKHQMKLPHINPTSATPAR
jgi:hypothetical protein